jgi:hypothetical protein
MKKLFILLTVLLVVGSACKKGFLNVDEVNPNNASAVPASFILPAALNGTSISMNTPGNYPFVYEWYGLWSISGGYSQDLNMTGYNLVNTSFQQIFSNAYLNLENYDYIEKNSTTASLRSFRAIAKIMKAYVFHNLVDVYGDIPYTEALRVQEGIKFQKPKYDSQQSIYEDLVIQLDTAMNLIANIPVDATPVGANDIIFQGDMGKWARFANTIKLKMLLQQADMAGRTSYITGALATTTSVGYLGAGEGAWLNPGYLHTTGKQNPFWDRFYASSGSSNADGITYFAAGQDACDFLTANNDPRKTRFFQPISGTKVQGNYFGQLVLQTVPNTSKIGFGMLRNYNQNAPILTDIESLFLQAEAAQRGLIATPADAKTFYNDAITASVIYEGQKSFFDAASYVPLTAADAATYLAQTKDMVSFDASPNKLKAIITQKWCALNGLSPMPIWTDYRRTGFPDFIHFSADPNKKNPTPPVRMLYPQTELSSNPDNVPANIDAFASKIFWQNR